MIKDPNDTCYYLKSFNKLSYRKAIPCFITREKKLWRTETEAVLTRRYLIIKYNKEL
jgi:hypothetical protein